MSAAFARLPGREVAGLTLTAGLLLAVAALGTLALGWLAFALYAHLLAGHDATTAALVTGFACLVAAPALKSGPARRDIPGSAAASCRRWAAVVSRRRRPLRHLSRPCRRR
ncbi:MAG: hypothetical protein AB7P12_14310 [Alphaproteobacteria bacterium]